MKLTIHASRKKDRIGPWQRTCYADSAAALAKIRWLYDEIERRYPGGPITVEVVGREPACVTSAGQPVVWSDGSETDAGDTYLAAEPEGQGVLL